MSPIKNYAHIILDITVTLILWMYFIIIYVYFFMPITIMCLLIPIKRETNIQYINYIFYKGFFLLAKLIIPNLDYEISDTVKNIRSSIIVCNHRSYLDPILFISLFKKHKTIVKGSFFHVPVFGWILRAAGYIPYVTRGEYKSNMIDLVKQLKNFLNSGGNIFIFPEGTRSRDGNLNPFKKGAFSIAKRCESPVDVLFIKNTEEIFRPGSFLFNTSSNKKIVIEHIGTIKPDYANESVSIKKMIEDVKSFYEEHKNKNLIK